MVVTAKKIEINLRRVGGSVKEDEEEVELDKDGTQTLVKWYNGNKKRKKVAFLCYFYGIAPSSRCKMWEQARCRFEFLALDILIVSSAIAASLKTSTSKLLTKRQVYLYRIVNWWKVLLSFLFFFLFFRVTFLQCCYRPKKTWLICHKRETSTREEEYEHWQNDLAINRKSLRSPCCI